MNGIQGIIFDCDGVLFESKKANLAYYNTILESFNKPPVNEDDHEKAHLCHTAASAHVLSQLLDPGQVGEALSLASTLDYRQFIPYMEPEPGMVNALQQLSEAYPLAIATNRGYSMPNILEHFSISQYFDVVVTSRDVELPKPAPDMLYEAAQRLNLAPGKLLFVGDSELDQAAAKSAGVSFANYRGNLEADFNIDHHDQLLTFFQLD